MKILQRNLKRGRFVVCYDVVTFLTQ
jgi:hypothetical protein